jgi:hypothetical protein
MSTFRICAALLFMAAPQISTAASDKSTQCEVSKGSQRNDALMAIVPDDGTFIFKPGGPGFVDRDGALGIKFAWVRFIPGVIKAGGKRLDGAAPPARAYFNKGYGKVGGHPSYLVFPTPGCWQITGQLGDKALTFVVWVEKTGEGPAWRYELPNDGSWYATQL